MSVSHTTDDLFCFSGVVVIDDQPDINAYLSDSQEGFQQVMSRREKRARKDILNQEEKVSRSCYSCLCTYNICLPTVYFIDFVAEV